MDGYGIHVDSRSNIVGSCCVDGSYIGSVVHRSGSSVIVVDTSKGSRVLNSRAGIFPAGDIVGGSAR